MYDKSTRILYVLEQLIQRNEVKKDEIQDMFADYSQAERHFEFVKPKRKMPQYKLDEIQGQFRLWQD